MRRVPFAALLLSLSLGLPAMAEVKSVAPQGFEVVETVTVHPSPHDAFADLVKIAAWWDGSHSFSHDAANLSLEPKVGGCWCERLDKGGMAQHLTVTFLLPDQMIELRGAFGPLRFEGIDGVFRWTLKPAEGGGTQITQSYIVGGYMREGAEHWAPIVDKVLGEALHRFARFADTGSPETK